MNDECGPGPSGIADDFGVAVEMALKARLVSTECGPWKNTDGHRAMEAALKFELGHEADVILGRLPPEDIEAIKKLYEDCVDAHRGVRLPPGATRNAEAQRIGDGRLLAYHGICGPDVDRRDFKGFIKWVGRAVHERYKPGGPEIPLPVGGAVRPDPQGVDVEIPSFADRLIEWVTEPMDRLRSGRTLREMLKADWNIAAARAAEPAPGRRKRSRVRTMTKETWTIIGTMVAIGVLLSGIVINQNSQLNTRIQDMQDRMDDGFGNVNQRFNDMQDRMDDGFGSVNQRFNDMNQRMTDGFANLQRQIDELQTDVRELRSMQFEALKNDPPAN